MKTLNILKGKLDSATQENLGAAQKLTEMAAHADVLRETVSDNTWHCGRVIAVDNYSNQGIASFVITIGQYLNSYQVKKLFFLFFLLMLKLTLF